MLQSVGSESTPASDAQSPADIQSAQLNTDQPLNRRERRSHAKKNTKAAIKIVSLNMKGHGSLNPNSVRNKWMHINQIIRDKKIGVLLLQEMHMSKTRHDETQKLFWKRLKIFSSEDPENPTGKGGVAIVLNKALIQTKGQENIKTTEIIPGRALLMSIKYRPPEPPKLTVLVVYSPNEHGKNKLFWDEIKTFFENHPHIPRPDIMAGDFNVVEDTIDRLPTHPDPPDATDTLDSLKSYLRL